MCLGGKQEDPSSMEEVCDILELRTYIFFFSPFTVLHNYLDIPDLYVHDAGEDGGELLLCGAAYDGLLVLAVLCPQGGDQAHKHSQDVRPDLEFEHDVITTLLLYMNCTGLNKMNSVSLFAKYNCIFLCTLGT